MNVNLIVNGLYKKSGGLPKAVIKRAKMFAENDISVVLYTMAYQPNLQNLKKEYIAEGKLHEQVEVKSIYQLASSMEKISSKDSYKFQKRHISILKLLNMSKLKKLANELIIYKDAKRTVRHVRVQYQDKKISRIFYYTKNKISKQIDFFNEKTKIIGISTNKKDMSSRIDTYVENDFIIANVKVVNNNFIETTVDNIEFSSNVKAYSYLLNKVITKNDLVFGEYRDLHLRYMPQGSGNLDDVIKGLNTEKKICVIHNSAHTVEGKTIPNYKKPICEDIYSKIILLTNEQKEDLVKEFSNANFEVIPNSYLKPKLVENISVNLNKIIVVSRITKKKGTDLLVKIARHLKSSNSSLEIHYYGHGNNDQYEKDIKKIIRDEQLPIIFEAVTNNITIEYQKSLCLLMTSELEGQGQVMYEAVLANTPILSNLFKYGLKDLLKENINGYIYKDYETFKDFDEKIKELINNQNNNKYKNIAQTAEEFLEKNVIKKWLKLLKEYETE